MLAVTALDGEIEALARAGSHVVLALWAADCAERVLPLYESAYPEDDRPRRAIAACREWARSGVFHMAVIRQASLDAHAAARAVQGNDAARAAARSAGQAAASAHAGLHAVAAARYAASTVRDAAAAEQAAEAALAERAWQLARLRELNTVR